MRTIQYIVSSRSLSVVCGAVGFNVFLELKLVSAADCSLPCLLNYSVNAYHRQFVVGVIFTSY